MDIDLRRRTLLRRLGGTAAVTTLVPGFWLTGFSKSPLEHEDNGMMRYYRVDA